jgi:PKD repeat protein
MYGCSKSVSQANINYFAASASASSAGGCAPLTIAFTDLSQQAIAWSWDFGDGNTSTSQNPSHTYTTDGIYSVMLVCTFPGNCTDTIVYNGMITINTPEADFFTPTQAGCSPSQISFVNQSNDASTYLWDFGDGTTSANLNPDHIYNIPGVYTIKLVATNASGCVDSLIRPAYISIPGTYTQFSLSGISNCQNSQVTFTDSSINASVWAWDFGDGNIGNTQNPVHVYQDTGSYIVTLITEDSIGCSSSYTYPMPLVINPVPNASGYSNILSGCDPLPLQFSNTSNGALSYEWILGDGTTSPLDSLPHTYTTAGIYIPQLIATNGYGCKDTFNLAPIDVMMSPLPAFSSDTIWGCIGSTIQFNNQTLNSSNAGWYWDFGFTNSTAQDPAIMFTTPGTYNVMLTATNDNGCTNTISQNAYIEIFDSIPPPETPVYTVSVVDDTNIDITFENLPVKDFGKYTIYRYNAATANYQPIKVFTRGSINLANTITYRDTGLDTKNNSYRYKIQTTDLCDYEIPFNDLEEYTSINVTAATASTNLYVSWTPYTGCTFYEYEIYRKQEPNGTFQLIATVDSSVTDYLDTTLYCPHVYTYRIQATTLCGRNYSAWSDTSAAQPENPMENQQVELTKTTVVNNEQTLTEWQPPAILPNLVSAYLVLRGIDGNTAAPYTLLPGLATSFIDDSVDVNTHSYSYFIIPVNDCDLEGIISREGKSILLEGFWSNYQTYLKWTPYEKWPSGVQQYVIEKLQDDGSWLPVNTTFGTDTNTVLDE